MALHHQLPIYKTGVDLMKLAIDVQLQLPRSLKRSLGDKICDHCAQMLDLMAMANATKAAARARHIEDLLSHLRAMSVLMRVGHEATWIKTPVWSKSVQLLDSIGRQGGGWLKTVYGNPAPAA